MAEEAQRWVAVQGRTFAKLCNAHLAARGMSVDGEHIGRDLADGVALALLVEKLTGAKVPGVDATAPRPAVADRAARLANVTAVFAAIAAANIKHEVSASDVVDGNNEQVVKLLWAIIQEKQLQKGHDAV
eukprot:TRINITY_DN8022_c0_g1_i1.p1 TRINITY_DN8022_c0_g1~~TRINITY_DN8022_c0_g1_i1.p1  ORF type:complete len:142 (-),score=58.92 TRINITY_DN8022_c0_g1_i1:95-484(-)